MYIKTFKFLKINTFTNDLYFHIKNKHTFWD